MAGYFTVTIVTDAYQGEVVRLESWDDFKGGVNLTFSCTNGVVPTPSSALVWLYYDEKANTPITFSPQGATDFTFTAVGEGQGIVDSDSKYYP